MSDWPQRMTVPPFSTNVLTFSTNSSSNGSAGAVINRMSLSLGSSVLNFFTEMLFWAAISASRFSLPVPELPWEASTEMRFTCSGTWKLRLSVSS